MNCKARVDNEKDKNGKIAKKTERVRERESETDKEREKEVEIE